MTVDFDPFAGPSFEKSAPSTEPQREIFAAVQMGPDASCAFNESVSLRFTGELDLNALKASIQALVERHESLHSIFSKDGRSQLVQPKGTLSAELPVIDLSDVSVEQREEHLQGVIAREVETPFDLEVGPLLRTKVVKLAEGQHQLVITAHHIVVDGWSMGVILRDLGALYTAELAGRSAPLGSAPSFVQYALNERAAETSEAHAIARKYWIEQFSRAVPALDLPTDRKRPALKTYASRRIDFPLPKSLTDRIKSAGAKLGASYFVTLLAGFAATLHRLTRQDDLVIGVPAAGQAVAGEQDLVGHGVNMLPLRLTIEDGMTFSQLVKAARRSLLDGSEHQQLSFGALLKQLSLQRDPSRLPLTSVLFNVDKAISGEELGFAGMDVRFLSNPRHFENFDLFINAAETRGETVIEAQYNTDLFDRDTVLRWLSGMRMLLESAVESSRDRIDDLNVLTSEDVARIESWNATAAAFAREATVQEMFEAQVDRRGDATALTFRGQSLSYLHLEERANQVARALRKSGGGAGTLVGLCVERSPEMVAALLGILKAGCAYVPLDPAYPEERLRFMVEDSGMPLLLTTGELRDALSLRAPKILTLHDTAAEETSRITEKTTEAGNPAYVIYTSGSTGTPKGVCVPHRAISNFISAMRARPGIREDDTLVAVTTLSFDIAVLELHVPLTTGAHVILAAREEAQDGALLRPLAERATIMQATPSTWRMLLGAGWEGRQGADDSPPAFRALVGGEALPRDLADKLTECVDELWNMYGPTETTVWSTCQRIHSGQPIRIGRPIANTTIEILDGRLGRQPVGVIGELHIGGDGLTLGYLHRPELTAERFIPDPFRSGRALYKTGDLARWMPDGTLEYIGRNDNQVKVRGFRIELGEIEATLARHPAVAGTAVVIREDRPGDVRVVAYVVSKPGTSVQNPGELLVEDGELRAHLRHSLPDYMIPQHFVAVAALPLTPNGKVDRKALPPPRLQLANDADFVAPRSDLERRLADIWQETLGISRLSVTANFFELGGHSLLAAQAMTRLSEAEDLQLSMRTLFMAPTVERMAAVVSEAKAKGAGRRHQIRRVERRGYQPLSLMQQRLWMMEEVTPGTALYNLPSAFRFKGPLDWGTLERAINEIIRRQDVLRTTLHWHESGPMQLVADELKIDLEPIDLTAKDAELANREMMEILRAAASETFDLSAGPLFRVLGIKLAHDDNVLFFMPHHAVWDGWSFDIFLRELGTIYAAYAQGRQHGLAELPVRYTDYSVWYLEYMKGPELQRQRAYWSQKLAGGIEPLDFPTDRPRPAQITYLGATEPFEINREEVDALNAMGRQHGATLYMVMLAAFKLLLHRYCNQEDIVVGTPIRGRGQPEVEDVIGFFVNTLVLRTSVAGDPEFTELLDRVRTTVLDAFANQDIPFEQLLSELNVARDMSRTPIFQAFFTFQDVSNRISLLGDIPYEQIHVHAPVSPTDISLWVKETGDGLTGGLDYSTDLFEQPTMARFLAQYRQLLQALARNARVRVSEIDILTADEKRHIEFWNRTEVPFDRAATVHSLFEAQVDRTPDRIAITFAGKETTYRALDQQANRICHALREAGVGKGTFVGLCVERSVEMVAAFMGVLKAGGAYLPLDPAYPRERLEFIAEDSRMSILLTTEALTGMLDLPDARIVTVESAADLSPERSGQETTEPEQPAYVIYTSGSTGRPKGVCIPHRAVSNFVTAMQERPGITGADSLVAVTTLSFDIAVLELHVSLCSGARVILASREEAQDGRALIRLLEDATIMQATPSTWRLLFSAGWAGRAQANGSLPAIKALVGGEALPGDLADQLALATGELWNMYGPTETTVWSTCQRILPGKPVRIGKPIANTHIEILDSAVRRTPIGISGELHIGGAGVALGYWNRRELTAERFMADPHRPGEALYRTGDVARWLADGTIEYLGRNDNQVKVRGYRIELGEIEATLSRHRAIAECAVAVRKDKSGDVNIVAYFVPQETEAHTHSDLRRHLRKTLPEYMIPQHFVELEKLPQTPNGKLDRNALPAPAQANSVQMTVEPRTDAERMLANLFKESLHVEHVSVHDNFFNLGGHSLLCLQVIARIEDRTGVRLSPRLMLLNTLEQIAELLTRDEPQASAASSVPVKQENASSFAQKILRRIGL
jgi:amino acid adenylation domain-containing protein